MSTDHAQAVDSTTPPAMEEAAVSIDPQKLQRYVENIRNEQSMLMGITGGLVGATLGAVLWAVITVLTKYQTGYMALAFGFLTGFGVRLLGKGVGPAYRFVGATLALAGCLAGNLMVVLIFGSFETGMSVMTIASRLTPSIIVQLFTATFNIIDLLFYGLAITIGFRTALRSIPKEDLPKLV